MKEKPFNISLTNQNILIALDEMLERKSSISGEIEDYQMQIEEIQKELVDSQDYLRMIQGYLVDSQIEQTELEAYINSLFTLLPKFDKEDLEFLWNREHITPNRALYKKTNES
jgi:type I site-specific restriction endonuclease